MYKKTEYTLQGTAQSLYCSSMYNKTIRTCCRQQTIHMFHVCTQNQIQYILQVTQQCPFYCALCWPFSNGCQVVAVCCSVSSVLHHDQCVAPCCSGSWSMLKCLLGCLIYHHSLLLSKISPWTHCNTLQHAATHCNTLRCNTPRHTATHCNTLQHTATHCNTLQHFSTWLLHGWDYLWFNKSDFFLHDTTRRYVHTIIIYGVASVSSIDKIIGFFCKRALYKRRYSANETYKLIDPTDRSHPTHVCAHTCFCVWVCVGERHDQFICANMTHACARRSSFECET